MHYGDPNHTTAALTLVLFCSSSLSLTVQYCGLSTAPRTPPLSHLLSSSPPRPLLSHLHPHSLPTLFSPFILPHHHPLRLFNCPFHSLSLSLPLVVAETTRLALISGLTTSCQPPQLHFFNISSPHMSYHRQLSYLSSS